MSTTPNQKDLLAKKSDLEGILKPDDNDVLHLPDVTITLAESGQFYLAGIDKKLLTLIGNTSGNAVTLDGDAGLTFTTSGGSNTITGITSSSGNSTSLAASQSMASAKQDKIIAGTNIQIAQDGKTISATDTNELENLTDVNITTPTDGQGLVYNNTTQKWENGTVSSASSIDTLTDVNLTNLTNGQILKYNSTSQEWENANESGGGGGSTVIPNPTGTPTDTLDTVSIDGTIYEIQGSGGGGVSFEEEQLYKASSISFSNITVDWDWNDYDLYILYSNDDLTQSGESTVLTKEKITDLISNQQQISLYPYAYGACIYTPTANQLTANSNTNYFTIIEIIGIKLGGSGGSSEVTYSTTEHKVGTWIDGSNLYERTINITTGSFPATQDMDISNYIDSTEVVHESIGVFNYTYEGASYALPINGSSANILYWNGVYKLRLSLGPGWLDSTDIYITIRYTKTT